jgi:ATP-dependent 26S proteasome regulatory subunit
LLARATAGEANIPFIACSSSSLLLGSEGPEKLREIFKFAYEKAPCVLFFDEIDCIGRSRNHQLAKPETQCLTEELLVQLDGK